MTVTIVDYGVGNLGSIRNMLKKIGVPCVVSSDACSIDSASKIILPGVGSFDAGMRQLHKSGLRACLEAAVLDKKIPVAGICLGMQMMTNGSQEGNLPGLGWVPGYAARFVPGDEAKSKVPHMGWNIVDRHKESPVLNLLDEEARFYFVHSYYVTCKEPRDVLLTSRHGGTEFVAAYQRENILGVQFHPEKSHRFGLALLKAFAELF